MVRQALVALLELEADMEVVAQAADGHEALAMARKHRPVLLKEGTVLAAAAGHEAIAEIAGRLHLSPGTVRNHLSAAIQKLGARNRAEAADIAQQRGWL